MEFSVCIVTKFDLFHLALGLFSCDSFVLSIMVYTKVLWWQCCLSRGIDSLNLVMIFCTHLLSSSPETTRSSSYGFVISHLVSVVVLNSHLIIRSISLAWRLLVVICTLLLVFNDLATNVNSKSHNNSYVLNFFSEFKQKLPLCPCYYCNSEYKDPLPYYFPMIIILCEVCIKLL